MLVDMDDVLEDLTTAWTSAIHERYGYYKASEDITEWDMWKFYPDLEPNYLYDILEDPDFWATIKPFSDAIEYIPKLQKYFDVYVLTAGNYKSISSKIINIIFKYFPTIDNDHVIVCHNKQLVKGDIIIDDGIHNLVGHSAKYKILFDTPHNRVPINDDIIRLFNWKDIYDYLTRIYDPNVDRCVIYGEYVPEGTMVCNKCYNKYKGGE